MDLQKALSFIKRNNIQFHVVQEFHHHREICNYASLRTRYEGILITFWKKYKTDGQLTRYQICDNELNDVVAGEIDGEYPEVMAVFDLVGMIQLSSNGSIMIDNSYDVWLTYVNEPSNIQFNIYNTDTSFKPSRTSVYIKDMSSSFINKFKLKYFSKYVKIGHMNICRDTLLDDILHMGWYLEINVEYAGNS